MQVDRRVNNWVGLFSAKGPLFVVVSRNTQILWVGRMISPELVTGEDGSKIIISAYGLWESLNDIPILTNWSSTSVQDWRPLNALDRSLRLPERFVIDNNNRLFIGLKQGQSYSNTTVFGALGYQKVDRGLRSLASISADVEHNLPSATWKIRVGRLDTTNFTGTYTTLTTISGTGSVATTTINQTWSALCGSLIIDLFYDSAVATTYSGEDGERYVSLTNIRVKTTTDSTVVASAVTSDIASTVNAVNSFIQSTATTTNPGYDLTDLVFADESATTALNRIASYGDGAGTVYVAGVDNYGYVYLRPLGDGGRVWSVDIADLNVSSDREKIANSVYAVYKDAGGRVLRTSTTTDADSIARYGYTRRAAVSVDTTNQTRAEQWRDTYISDNATAKGSAKISFNRVYTLTGGAARLTDVMPGDTISIRNLPFSFNSGDEIDRVKSFRVTETEYDAIENRLTVTPETPLPRLDVLIAQNAI